jgi:hypothetical protein
MIQTVIPRDQWLSFCEQFSSQHLGWLTTIGKADTSSAERGRPRTLAVELPLQGLVLEERDRGYDLMLIAGTSPEHFTCVIHQPAQICLDQEDEGEHVGLTVHEASGQTMVARFRVAASPELLDDVTPGEW